MDSNQSAKFVQLQKSLKDWLSRNGLDHDLHYYTIEQWISRKEDYLNDALSVIVFESGLYSILNGYCPDSDALDEFEDLLNSFGFSYEMGHAWNLGLYALEDHDFAPSDGNYKQKLCDVRWQDKRKAILERADFQCEDCGHSKQLEIHHCIYIYGHEPWEYPLDLLRCLCRACHKNRPKAENQMRTLMASLTTDELNALYQYATAYKQAT